MHATAPSALAESTLKPAAALAEMAARLDFEQVPSPARLRGKLSILDALGVGLASNAFPYAHRAMAGIHSCRSATFGSTWAARQAGRPMAATATTVTTTTMPASVVGSIGATP